MALGIREAMGRAVGAEPAGLGQGADIAAVGLDRAGAGGLHGGAVRVGDDALVAEGLEAAGDSFALGRGRSGSALGADGDLAVPLVHVDANVVLGWSLPFCGGDRGCSCGPASSTTSSGEAS